MNTLPLIVALQQGPLHIRELARRLEVDPTYVSRLVCHAKSQELVVESVKGRKKLIEHNLGHPAIDHMLAQHNYEQKLAKLGETKTATLNLLHRLRKKFGQRIKAFYVFGSVAKGSYKHKISDIDVCIVMDKLPDDIGERIDVFSKTFRDVEWEYHIPFDLVEYDLEDIEGEKEKPSPVFTEICKYHIKVFDTINLL